VKITRRVVPNYSGTYDSFLVILFFRKILSFNRYYDQLHAIEDKLPITASQIRIHFKWHDAFVSGGSLFGSKQKGNGSWKLAFEKACVLFNIGHAYSEMATAQDMSIEKQIQRALRYFQLSSGVYSYLKDYVSANSLSHLSIDFEPVVLDSLSWLMLAQAAELIYMKSLTFKGKKKNKVLFLHNTISPSLDEARARIAAHASDCYKEAYTSAKTESAKKIIPDVS
jgi:hypothetical protein